MAPKGKKAASQEQAPAKSKAKAKAKANAEAKATAAWVVDQPKRLDLMRNKLMMKELPRDQMAIMTMDEWKDKQKGMKEAWPQPQYIIDNPQPDRAHTNYRDETYEIVTRWMAETRIEYRPHAKAPGSKSHIRYEQYSKAKTVGEALQLGTYPIDWCWDYERGFIRVLGPVRHEPIDPVHCFDEKALTEVDRCIYRWSLKEVAKKLGVSLQELRDDKNSGESAIMRAHRLVAQRVAKEALKSAQLEARKITDNEVLRTLQEWGFARNPNRNNVMPDGRDWVWSDTLGLLRDRLGSIHITRATGKYPEVVELLNKWLVQRLPVDMRAFKFTSINLNKNYAAKQHRDGNNFGPSMIAAFGDFKGGELNYWAEDNKSEPLEKLLADRPKEQLDIGTGLALFNGNCAHSVEPIDGERYSVVYFTAGCHTKIHAEDLPILQELGMPYPSPDEDQYALLRAPKGYGSSAGDAPATSQPAFCLWPRVVLDKRATATFGEQKRTAQEIKAWEDRRTKISKMNFGHRRPESGGADETPEKVEAIGSGGATKRAARGAAGGLGKKAKKEEASTEVAKAPHAAAAAGA